MLAVAEGHETAFPRGGLFEALPVDGGGGLDDELAGRDCQQTAGVRQAAVLVMYAHAGRGPCLAGFGEDVRQIGPIDWERPIVRVS